jgi:hypothetical protein
MSVLHKLAPMVQHPLAAPVCVGCGGKILPLPDESDGAYQSFGGDVRDVSGGTPYQGVVCETCHRTWCSSCWVPMLVADKDICTACGTKLVPLSSAGLA